jgi:hypothetical protein
MNSKRSLFVVLLRVNPDISDYLAIAFRLFGIFLRANNFVQRVNLLFSKPEIPSTKEIPDFGELIS